MVLRRTFIILVFCIFSVILVRLNAVINEGDELYKPDIPVLSEGVYRGRGYGFAGPVDVEVFFSSVKPSGEVVIKDIIILGHSDVSKYWDKAAGRLKPAVIESQSAALDSVTGATASSRGFLEAVNDAKNKSYLGR